MSGAYYIVPFSKALIFPKTIISCFGSGIEKVVCADLTKSCSQYFILPCVERFEDH